MQRTAVSLPTVRPTVPDVIRRETQTFTDDKGNVTQNPKISSTEELLADAARVEGKFTSLLTTIAKFTEADVTEHMVTKKAKVKDPKTGKEVKKKTQTGRQIFTEEAEVLSKAAPLKGAERIEEKLTQKYEQKHERILDVVRGTLAYADCGKLADALLKLKEFCSGRDDLKIVRCKQLFRVKGKKSKTARKKGKQSKLDKKLAEANVGPSAAVYGDVKVSLSVDDHVCELQFNLVPMLEAKSTKSGHGAYEAMRKLEAEWVTTHKGAKAMPDIDTLHKMADDDHPDVKKIKGTLQKAIHASQAAYGSAYNEIRKHEDFDRMITTAETLA